MVTLYNVVSSDGYIADRNGAEEFIPDELWPKTLDLIGRFDALVMGRKTYETLQSYPSGLLTPLESLSIRKIVVSSDPSLQLKDGYSLEPSPEDAITSSSNTLVSAGASLNNYLLEHDLVDRIIFHQIPITLGEGLPVFDPAYRNRLVPEKEVDIGLAKELIYIRAL